MNVCVVFPAYLSGSIYPATWDREKSNKVIQANPVINDVSVIICAYTEKRLKDLLAAINSVQRQTRPPEEIIVVVDHNVTLLSMLRERDLDVVVVENIEEHGLSGARNSGIAVARGDIIVFLDDDAIATSDWLRALCASFDDPRLLGIGGSVVPLWLERDPIWMPEEFYWVVGCTYRGLPRVFSPVRNPIGANMSFRREIFDAIGGFRHEIGRIGTRPIGCEETELSIRAQRRWPHGLFFYQPAAQVFHRVPSTRSCWRYFCARCFAEGLSKAVVTRYVGSKDALASERSYSLQTLPRGILRNMRDGLLHLDSGGFLRAGAIVAGFAMTTAGYVAGHVVGLLTMPHAERLPDALSRRRAKMPQPVKSQSKG
jgi:glucosyl-dolichyl phosphate glucuronosyltransferase